MTFLASKRESMQTIPFLILWSFCLDGSVDSQPPKDSGKPEITYWDRLRTDYGKPAAQFEAADVAALAGKFLNKKITIKGQITNVDVSEPKHCLVHMNPGITFDFVEMKKAAESCKVGDTMFIDGILKSHSAKGEILLAPAFTRDPKAPFLPMKP
jgi:hypothetical protein